MDRQIYIKRQMKVRWDDHTKANHLFWRFCLRAQLMCRSLQKLVFFDIAIRIGLQAMGNGISVSEWVYAVESGSGVSSSTHAFALKRKQVGFFQYSGPRRIRTCFSADSFELCSCLCRSFCIVGAEKRLWNVFQTARDFEKSLFDLRGVDCAFPSKTDKKGSRSFDILVPSENMRESFSAHDWHSHQFHEK